jgi:tetratricopeptide (TPR) repeat protein
MQSGSKKPVTLKRFSTLLKDQPLNRLPSRVLVDLDTVSREELWSLIEVIKLRPGGHSLVQRMAVLDPLPQQLPEKISTLLAEGHFQKAIETLLPLLQNSSLPFRLRGELLRLTGEAWMELGKTDQARTYFETALDHSSQMDDELGIFSSLLSLAKVTAISKQTAISISYFKRVAGILGQHRLNLSFYLGYYRCLAEAGILSRAKSFEILMLSCKMAQCLNEPVTEAKIRLEAGVLSRFEGGELDFQKIMKSVESASWFYDRGTGFFIDLATGETKNLVKNSPNEKILIFLMKNNGAMSIEGLFEKIWKIKWHPLRHLNVLKMSIFRFNRAKIGVKINRREGSLELSLRGIVLNADFDAVLTEVL